MSVEFPWPCGAASRCAARATLRAPCTTRLAADASVVVERRQRMEPVRQANTPHHVIVHSVAASLRQHRREPTTSLTSSAPCPRASIDMNEAITSVHRSHRTERPRLSHRKADVIAPVGRSMPIARGDERSPTPRASHTTRSSSPINPEVIATNWNRTPTKSPSEMHAIRSNHSAYRHSSGENA